ncbi:hypothetical protein P1X14_13315 [Sphingomonas sp. AOB5]|uniref:hypothetical protein n=1 Tax=Sphingomonas sp. AOB5 TaxID=3034017 RepID=UPI0023F81D44|nr:hypothetical protein [Sphingomonas sp. AOB5]MDF7776232.1 hypothetical protein [Sphingomonas sp. AOB5]
MKILPLAAAAVLAAFAVPASASVAVSPAAAPISGSLVTTMIGASGSAALEQDRRYGRDRRYQRDRRYERRHHARRSYWKRTCRTYWRNGHRQRDCRRVRYWR